MDVAYDIYDFEINGTTLNKYNGRSASVIIPDGITSIGYSAFANCNCVEKILIPDGVTSIGYSAFKACPNLKMVIIPERDRKSVV